MMMATSPRSISPPPPHICPHLPLRNWPPQLGCDRRYRQLRCFAQGHSALFVATLLVFSPCQWVWSASAIVTVIAAVRAQGKFFPSFSPCLLPLYSIPKASCSPDIPTAFGHTLRIREARDHTSRDAADRCSSQRRIGLGQLAKAELERPWRIRNRRMSEPLSRHPGGRPRNSYTVKPRDRSLQAPLRNAACVMLNGDFARDGGGGRGGWS